MIPAAIGGYLAWRRYASRQEERQVQNERPPAFPLEIDSTEEVVKDENPGTTLGIQLTRYRTDLNQSYNSDIPRYGFVLDLDSITSLSQGWKVYMDNETVFEYCNDQTKLWHKIAVLGYYSKGKSFIVNGLYRAGKRLSNNSFFTQATDNNFSIDVGFGVTTRGISAVFTGGDGTIEKADTLICDTAGRNAPAPRRSSDFNEMQASIDQLRSKERLSDDVMIEIADLVLYVVDELLNEDQRTIFHFLEEGQKSNQTLFVVHNFKRRTPDEPGLQKFLKEQIERPFEAVKKILTPDQKYQYGDNFLMWQSSFSGSTKVATINHLVLFDNNTYAGSRYNQSVFSFIVRQKSERQNLLKFQGSPVRCIARAIGKHLGKYFRLVALPPNALPAVPVTEVGTANCAMSIKAFTSMTNMDFELLKWSTREMPMQARIRLGSNDFTPNWNHFTNEEVDLIRVDLAGIGEDDYVHEGEVPSPGKPYYSVKKVLLDSSPKNNFFYIIEGFRPTFEFMNMRDDKEQTFGNFSLTIPVLYYYNPATTVITVTNSVLVIKTFAQSLHDASRELKNNSEY